MVLLAFVQVVLRNLLDQGILWADILLRNLVLWVGFIGASLATREEKHISIDLLTRILPGKWKNFARFFMNIFALLICLLLAEAGWTFVMDEKLYGTKIFGEVPAWYFQIIIPLGFLLMAFRFCIISLQHMGGLLTKKKQDEQP
jgi:TRAP-type C4-dicarboxylate transport system permease small subunit